MFVKLQYIKIQLFVNYSDVENSFFRLELCRSTPRRPPENLEIAPSFLRNMQRKMPPRDYASDNLTDFRVFIVYFVGF